MPSLVTTRSRPLPVVVRRQLLHAVVVQHHCHWLPLPSAAVAVSRLSYYRQSAVSCEGTVVVAALSMLDITPQYP